MPTPATQPLLRYRATDLPEVSDEEVVERVLGGEQALFELLMRRYNQRLFRVARSIVASDGEAEDVVQDAWVRAYSHLGQYAGRARFSTWLTRILVYEARARNRRQRRIAPLETALPQGPGSGEPASRLTEDPDPEEATASRELGAVRGTAIGRLPEGLRSVFVLREVEGLSTAETAACLGLSRVNVKVRLHRARAALRTEIDRRLGAATRRIFQFDGERCDRMVRTVFARLSETRVLAFPGVSETTPPA